MSLRLNRYIAQVTGLGRRSVDQLIAKGQVSVNGRVAELGESINNSDIVLLNNQPVILSQPLVVLILNKPTGYVSSREGQGSPTIYELLPKQYKTLKSIGRLDKDSSGLLLLTNDGLLANKLLHPSYQKNKVYEIRLDKPLLKSQLNQITDQGVNLDDGRSQLNLKKLSNPKHWQVTMTEGRNRQIRRTFMACGFRVVSLKRISFGPYSLGNLASGQYAITESHHQN